MAPAQSNPNNHEQVTTYHLIAETSHNGQRIDKFLANALPKYSRSFLQQLIINGNITINNLPAKSSTILKAHDHITVIIPITPLAPIFSPIKSNLGIEIIFSHPHFFIIYKPAGLLVHKPEVPSCQPTVVDWLLSYYNELKEVGNAERPGIIHRLDKDTSGLLIIARTNYAHTTFTHMFQKHLVIKTYWAIVHGHPPPSGAIDLAIGRDVTHRKKMTTYAIDQSSLSLTMPARIRQATRRAALTYYTTKEYFSDYALVEVKPVTGRTHQIRVHFAAIGHPLLGDAVYGMPSKLIARQALHAASLSFTFDKEQFNFFKEAPQDFNKVIELFKDN